MATFRLHRSRCKASTMAHLDRSQESHSRSCGASTVTTTPEDTLRGRRQQQGAGAVSAADVEPAGREGLMAEQPREPLYDTALEFAKGRLTRHLIPSRRTSGSHGNRFPGTF